MILLIPNEIEIRIRKELHRAGRIEIGGLLMGEHLFGDTFRVVDITAQRDGGSYAGFVRDPDLHTSQLESFFERTNGDYTRFNYVGEWHSHPNVCAEPSAIDIAEMFRLVNDPDVGVTFTVLLIVRLKLFRRLVGTATVFVQGRAPMAAKLIWERRSRRFRLGPPRIAKLTPLGDKLRRGQDSFDIESFRERLRDPAFRD